METLSRYIPFVESSNKQATAPMTIAEPEDRLFGGNFHRGFAMWFAMWYLFGSDGLGKGLVCSAISGLVIMSVSAALEGSRARLANRANPHTASVVARIMPFKLFGYFDILERTIPCWIPTSMSHSVPPIVFDYYRVVRPWLAK